MKIRATFTFLILMNTFSSIVFAHGENKPGPHGGFIRMPGAFHTEVVKEKSGYRVYLLDINWQNPSVLDSDVKAHIQAGKKKTELICAKESDSYLCQSLLPQKGELNITAKREGQAGNTASYKLPLKLEKAKDNMNGHSTDEHKNH